MKSNVPSPRCSKSKRRLWKAQAPLPMRRSRAIREIFRGKKVGIMLSGGNIDMRLLSNVILRELSREGRILSVVVEIEDRPGLLAKIATLIGEAGGNILEVSHNRMMTDMPAKSADLGMVIEARDAGHAEEIRTALESSGFTIRRTKPTIVLPPIQT